MRSELHRRLRRRPLEGSRQITDPYFFPLYEEAQKINFCIGLHQANGSAAVTRYRFGALDMRLIEPFGVQTGLSLGLDASGTMTEETYDGAGNVTSTREAPFALTFVMRRATGDRWLNVGVLPAGG